MGYKVIENLLPPKNGTVYDVFENRPETKEKIFIKRFENRADAKVFSKYLNLGGGFDGWTPDFFLVEFKV